MEANRLLLAGYVQVDVCGTALVVKSTVDKPVDVSLFVLPVNPVVSPPALFQETLPSGLGRVPGSKTVVAD